MTLRTMFAVAASALILAGCGGSGGSRPAAKASWVSREDVGDAIALLNRGEQAQARHLLLRVLEKQPGDSIARKLLRQIDTPAEKLLGATNFPYVVRPGDSMSSLAQRFLRDPMMFYALARYNDISPAQLTVGRTIRIPGQARRKLDRNVTAQERPKAGSKAELPAIAKQAKPAPRPANPARAAQLRAQGLEQLNRGDVDRAVMLLQKASQLDPTSSVIQRDLGRATRIQKTVRANGA